MAVLHATSAPQGTRHAPEPANRLLPAALAVLLAALLLVAAHHLRSTPYGDRLTVHARVAHATEPRTRGKAVEAHDPATGTLLWRHTRDGRRPLAALPTRGVTIALWDDGLITATDGRTVRWHRALPAATDWLPAHGATGVLRPLGPDMLAVVTPYRVTAYRLSDGDLRWVLPARKGCAFAPARGMRHGGALLLAQPCARAAAWTSQLIAVDDLGRITPHRRPLGNDVSGGRKTLARPR